MEARRLLRELWKVALLAVDPERLVSEYFRLHRVEKKRRRVGIFASGKAAVAMASGVPGQALTEALIVAPHGARVPRSLRPFVWFASHPHPDRSSLAAARAALAFFRGFGKDDLILALVSGGTSSLLCLPRPGITLAAKRQRVRKAMQNGWPIERINRLRISLSQIKGGRLAEATPASVVTLILSDVPGPGFRIVGSGPTVSRRKGGDHVVLLGGNRTGLDAAAALARSRNLSAQIESRFAAGEATKAGRGFASRLCDLRRGILLAGGETTVRHSSRTGAGGRSQEFALGAARGLAVRNCECTLLAAGSDGVDGNSKNAGAFVDDETIARARKLGLDPKKVLRAHDSARFFEALGDHFRPETTGGNVADWVFGVREGGPE